MDPAAMAAAAAALQFLFTLWQQHNVSEQEQEKFYQEEKAKFLANKPETLPDV